MLWLIDGYNVIRRDPDLRSHEAQNLEAGRRALVRLVKQLEALELGHRAAISGSFQLSRSAFHQAANSHDASILATKGHTRRLRLTVPTSAAGSMWQ